MKRTALFLGFAVSVGIVYWPILSGGYIFSIDWATLQMYPAFAAIADSLQRYGELPLWVPGYASGHAPFASHGYAYLQPLALAFSALADFKTAYHLTVTSYILAAIICLFYFARHFNLSKTASVIAAFTYGFSQYAFFFSHSDAPAYALFYPPLLFLIIFQNHERRSKTSALLALGVLATTLVLYGALPDTVFFTLLMGFALAAYLDLTASRAAAMRASANPGVQREKPARPAGSTRWRTTTLFLAMGSTSFLLAAPAIFPTLRAIDFSARIDSESTRGSIARGFTYSDLPQLIYPDFTPRLPYVPHPLSMIYIGTVSLFLGIWGAIRYRRIPYGYALCGLALVTFVTALPHSPVYALLRLFPPFSMLNYSFKFLPVMLTAFAVLAGVGFDELERSAGRTPFRRYAAIWQWICGIVFAGAVAFNIIWHTRLRDGIEQALVEWRLETKGGSAEHYRQVFEVFADRLGAYLSFENPRLVLALVFLGVTGIIAALWARGTLPSVRLRAVTAAAAALNMLLIWQGTPWFIKSGAMTMPPTLQAIHDQNISEPFRIAFAIPDTHIVSREDHPRPEAEYQRLKLAYAFGLRDPALFGLEGVDGDDPLLSRRYKHVLTMLGPSDYFRQTPEFAALTLEEKTELVSSRADFYGMLNVRYLITTYDLSPPWEKIADYTIRDTYVSVYENAAFLPRAYFPDTVTYLVVDEEQSASLLAKKGSFKKNSFIECLPSCPKAQETTETQAEVRFARQTPRGYSIAVNTAVPRWLVISESNTPYWRARIDGNQAAIYTANHVYKGVHVPAGTHVIEFEFPGLIQQAWFALKDLVNMNEPYAPYKI